MDDDGVTKDEKSTVQNFNSALEALEKENARLKSKVNEVVSSAASYLKDWQLEYERVNLELFEEKENSKLLLDENKELHSIIASFKAMREEEVEKKLIQQTSASSDGCSSAAVDTEAITKINNVKLEMLEDNFRVIFNLFDEIVRSCGVNCTGSKSSITVSDTNYISDIVDLDDSCGSKLKSSYSGDSNSSNRNRNKNDSNSGIITDKSLHEPTIDAIYFKDDKPILSDNLMSSYVTSMSEFLDSRGSDIWSSLKSRGKSGYDDDHDHNDDGDENWRTLFCNNENVNSSSPFLTLWMKRLCQLLANSRRSYEEKESELRLLKASLLDLSREMRGEVESTKVHVAQERKDFECEKLHLATEVETLKLEIDELRLEKEYLVHVYAENALFREKNKNLEDKLVENSDRLKDFHSKYDAICLKCNSNEEKIKYLDEKEKQSLHMIAMKETQLKLQLELIAENSAKIIALVNENADKYDQMIALTIKNTTLAKENTTLSNDNTVLTNDKKDLIQSIQMHKVRFHDLHAATNELISNHKSDILSLRGVINKTSTDLDKSLKDNVALKNNLLEAQSKFELEKMNLDSLTETSSALKINYESEVSVLKAQLDAADKNFAILQTAIEEKFEMQIQTIKTESLEERLKASNRLDSANNEITRLLDSIAKYKEEGDTLVADLKAVSEGNLEEISQLKQELAASYSREKVSSDKLQESVSEKLAELAIFETKYLLLSADNRRLEDRCLQLQIANEDIAKKIAAEGQSLIDSLKKEKLAEEVRLQSLVSSAENEKSKLEAKVVMLEEPLAAVNKTIYDLIESFNNLEKETKILDAANKRLETEKINLEAKVSSLEAKLDNPY